MDGIQARKTGSSSPLGLLFDHGCDALNVLFGLNVLLCSMDGNPSDSLFVCLTFITPSLPFFMATWEHYHTHHLHLPVLNGPAEGLIGLASICFVSAFYGSTYWQSESIYEGMAASGLDSFIPKFNNGYFIVGIAAAGSTREFLEKMLNVGRKFGPSSFLNVMPYFTLCLMWIVVAVFSPNSLERNPRILLCIGGLLFFEMAGQIMYVFSVYKILI